MKKVSILILLCMFINFTMPIVDVYADISFDFKSGDYHVAYIKDNIFYFQVKNGDSISSSSSGKVAKLDTDFSATSGCPGTA